MYFLPLSLFSFWNPYKVNVSVLDVVPQGPHTILIFLSSFSFCYDWVISTVLSGC